jgi:hypothetical protein
VSTFRKDDLRHNTLLADLNNTVPGEDSVYVKYLWQPAAAASVVQGKSTKDFFLFPVQDKESAWSIDKTTEVQISSAVVAHASRIHFVVEEDSGDHHHLGCFEKDNSVYDRRIGFFIEHVPSEEIGALQKRPIVGRFYSGNVGHLSIRTLS